LILHHSKICCLQCGSRQRIELSQLTFECLHKYANVFLHNCANVIWSLKRSKGRTLSFCFDYFSLPNFFNHIAKATSILHLKSGDSHKPNYFLTSTPLGHISLTHLFQVMDFLYGKRQQTYYKWWKKTTNWTWCPANLPFLFFFFLITVYIFLIYMCLSIKFYKVAPFQLFC
jgi:hypothetical protein